MSEWVKKNPVIGDHIRVKRSLTLGTSFNTSYYHHGLYIDDKHIIQFGSNSSELDPSKAEVMITDINGFLKGGELEVRIFTEEEKLRKRSVMESINYGYTQLGRKGYDLISNNCEHFVNECIFGIPSSEQVDNVYENLFSALGGMFKK